jgi:hypothetical protein
MGRKKIEKPKAESLLETVSRMLVPVAILADFDIYDAKETPSRWTIEMREKEGRIPKELQGCSDVVFDGYCNPVNTLSHSFVCKPIYLKIYRRRYKQSNKDVHFTNAYDLTMQGVKIVPELGVFLKEKDRIFSR